MEYIDKCTCCLESGRLRSMWDEHVLDGTREIYGQMLAECFALSWQQHTWKEHICELCVGRLRNAVAFKKQVVQTQLLLLEDLDDNKDADKVCGPIKMEHSSDYEDVEYLDTEYFEEIAQKNAPNKQSNVPNKSHTNVRNTRKRKVKIEDNITSIPEKVTITGSTVSKKLKIETDKLLIGDTTISKMQSILPGNIEEDLGPPETKLFTNSSKSPNIEDFVDNEQEVVTSELRTIQTKSDKPVSQLHERYERAKHQDNLRKILLYTNATPIRKHTDAGYMCAFCTKAFLDPADLKQHTIVEHNNATKVKYMKEVSMGPFCVKLDITSLHCNLCVSEIDTLEQLLEHLKSVHNKTVHTDIKNHFIPYKFLDGSNALKCFMCGLEFKYFKMITHHMSSHYKNFKCEKCNIYFMNNYGLTCHNRTHASGVFPCKYCPKVYDAKMKRTSHVRTFHKLQRYTITCGICGLKFKETTAKERHLEEHHGIQRKPAYKCYACDKDFFSQKSLKRHTDSFHLFVKNYKCSDCAKEFFDKRSYVAHMVSHSGVKEYKCDKCFRLFSHKRTLELHQRIHLNDRRYKCEYCDYAFIQKGSLLRHLKKEHGDM